MSNKNGAHACSSTARVISSVIWGHVHTSTPDTIIRIEPRRPAAGLCFGSFNRIRRPLGDKLLCNFLESCTAQNELCGMAVPQATRTKNKTARPTLDRVKQKTLLPPPCSVHGASPATALRQAAKFGPTGATKEPGSMNRAHIA